MTVETPCNVLTIFNQQQNLSAYYHSKIIHALICVQDGLITDSRHQSLKTKYLTNFMSGKSTLPAQKEVNIQQTLHQLRQLKTFLQNGWINPDEFNESILVCVHTSFQNYSGLKGLELAAVACQAGVPKCVLLTICKIIHTDTCIQDGFITDSQHQSLQSKYLADFASDKRTVTPPNEVNIEQTLNQLRELNKGFKSGWISPHKFTAFMRTSFEKYSGFKGLELAGRACKVSVTKDIVLTTDNN